jgi:uncharacterized protein YigA (DUF484 family)
LAHQDKDSELARVTGELDVVKADGQEVLRQLHNSREREIQAAQCRLRLLQSRRDVEGRKLEWFWSRRALSDDAKCKRYHGP